MLEFSLLNFLSFLIFLSLFWFIRTAKVILFWLYLWQLKEYHVGRFLDHFRTGKGKRLLLNKLTILKIILILIFYVFILWNPKTSCPPSIGGISAVLYFTYFILIVLLIYFLESVKGFYDFFLKKLKKPVLTKKTVLLISTGILVEFLVLLILILNIENIYWFAFWFLVFDILTPIIVSIIVFIFQPLAVLGRNQIIKKAKRKRDSFKNLLVIGITGSYGKTSTKEFLSVILSEKFNVLKTEKHQNSEVGISQCILNDLKPEHEIFICEMGAYNRGGIKLLSDIAKPKIGILTGINEQHMATFGSQENIVKAKFELIEALSEDGIEVLNWDNDLIIQNYKKDIKTIKYSLSKKEDIWAEDIKVEKDSLSFRVLSKDGNSADFKLNLMGTHNIINILGAVAVAKELGMSLEEISKACEKIEPWQSGIQLKKGINGLNIIDATYSANPSGVISHLEYLKIWPGKKVIIMPCLIELGKSSKEVHKRIGQKIGDVCDLAIITTKDRFKEIRDGAMAKGMKSENILFLENPKEIFEKTKEFSKPGDVILLESRVSAQLIKGLVI